MISNLQASREAGKLQKNWDFNKLVTQEHVDEIINVATNMPTKQNRDYYQLVASTDIKFNRQVYDIATIDPSSLHFNKHSPNSQVTAPLLLMYFATNLDNEEIRDEYEEQFFTSIGISSGAAALHSASLGYKTGFCACVRWNELHELLKEKITLKIKPKIAHGVLLGIGHALTKNIGGYIPTRSDVIVDDKLIVKSKVGPSKNIKVYNIQ